MADPIDIAVGNQLRRIRRLKDLSLYEVGDALGLSYQQVQKYERGANRISASKLVQLARYFNVGIIYFFEHVDLPDEGERALDDNVLKATALYARMPEEYQSLLKAFMKTIIAVSSTKNKLNQV